MELRKKFHGLVKTRGVLLPGVYNAATAKLIERLGFKGGYISGAALSASAGLPDIGILTQSEFITFARYIAQAAQLPFICDADTGFGEVTQVMRTVREYESLGLAGLHLEDQDFPKRCGHLAGKSLISAARMGEKVRAAVKARRDRHFLIIARTDARAVEGFDAAVGRAREYLRAGVDAIFPEGLPSRDEFKAFAKAVKAPLMANMTEFGVSPLMTYDELRRLGYKMVIFPVGAFRSAMKASEDFYKALRRTGTQKTVVKRMQTRQDLYDLLGYDGYVGMDKALAAATPAKRQRPPLP